MNAIITNLFESSQMATINDKNTLRKLMRSWGIPQSEITYVVTNHSQLPDGQPGVYIADEDSGVMFVTTTNYESVPIIKLYIKKNEKFADSEKGALMPGYAECNVEFTRNFFEERKKLSKKVRTQMKKFLTTKATESPRKAYEVLSGLSGYKFHCSNGKHLNTLLYTFHESFDIDQKEEYGNIMKLSSTYSVQSSLLNQMQNVKLGSPEAEKALSQKVYFTSAYLPDGKPGIFAASGKGLVFVLGRQDRHNRIGMEVIFCHYSPQVKKYLEIDSYQSEYKEFDKPYHSRICSQARNVLREFARAIKDIEKNREFENQIDRFVDKYKNILHLRD